MFGIQFQSALHLLLSIPEMQESLYPIILEKMTKFHLEMGVDSVTQQPIICQVMSQFRWLSELQGGEVFRFLKGPYKQYFRYFESYRRQHHFRSHYPFPGDFWSPPPRSTRSRTQDSFVHKHSYLLNNLSCFRVFDPIENSNPGNPSRSYWSIGQCSSWEYASYD